MSSKDYSFQTLIEKIRAAQAEVGASKQPAFDPEISEPTLYDGPQDPFAKGPNFQPTHQFGGRAQSEFLEKIKSSVDRATESGSSRVKTIAQQVADHAQANQHSADFANSLNVSKGPAYCGSPFPQKDVSFDFSGTGSKGKPDMGSVIDQYRYMNAANGSSANDGSLGLYL
ncbi:MAG: hypothetical protein KF874_11930 [Rhizobiaceae bacterium]|nr:hypothetical protein [Rhizobiaceae bacterium]